MIKNWFKHILQSYYYHMIIFFRTHVIQTSSNHLFLFFHYLHYSYNKIVLDLKIKNATPPIYSNSNQNSYSNMYFNNANIYGVHSDSSINQCATGYRHFALP